MILSNFLFFLPKKGYFKVCYLEVCKLFKNLRCRHKLTWRSIRKGSDLEKKVLESMTWLCMTFVFTQNIHQNKKVHSKGTKNLKASSFIMVMKVETTNLTSLPLWLAVVRIRTREIAVRNRKLNTTNRQNDSEAQRKSYPDRNVKQGLIISHLFVNYIKLIWLQPVLSIYSFSWKF